MKRLDQFLSVAARQMRIMPAALRDDELRELRGHLEQRAEDFENAGMSASEAQAQAVEGLGAARALGSRLCDAWEGIAFSWLRVLAAIVGVTAFLAMGVAAGFVFAMGTVPLPAQTPLFPEIGWALLALLGLYALLPLVGGWLFSHWLGRRGPLVALLYFGITRLNLTITEGTMPNGRLPDPWVWSPPPLLVEYVNLPWLAALNVALGLGGAVLCYIWRMRARRAFAGEARFELRPARVAGIPFHPRTWGRASIVLLAVVTASGAFYAGHVWITFHPLSPSSALRVALLRNRGGDEFEAPQILVLRELPPQTWAARASRERRVYFRVVASAQPYCRAKRLGEIADQIKLSSRYLISDNTRAARMRVRRNHQIVEGVVRVVKTPSGWQVDPKSFGRASRRLWSWFDG